MSDFPTKENPKLCSKGCGAKIYLSNETGKYLPYNLDDSQHDCRAKTNNNKKEENFVEHDVITLEQVLSKLRLVGIDLDLKKLLSKESEYIK